MVVQVLSVDNKVNGNQCTCDNQLPFPDVVRIDAACCNFRCLIIAKGQSNCKGDHYAEGNAKCYSFQPFRIPEKKCCDKKSRQEKGKKESCNCNRINHALSPKSVFQSGCPARLLW